MIVVVAVVALLAGFVLGAVGMARAYPSLLARQSRQARLVFARKVSQRART